MQIKITLIISLFLTGISWSQKFTNSPFSAKGLGEYGALDHATFSGMGNASTALIDSTILNFYNPSSYAFLAKGYPLFTTGLSSRFSNYTEQNNTNSSKYIGLDHFAFGISLFKNFGLAAGIKPFTRTGYNFKNTQGLGSDSLSYIYKGSGGTNQFFFGLSAKVFSIQTQKAGKHSLGLGVNTSYLFGNTLNERISYINTSQTKIAGGVEQKGYTLKSLYLDFGMNYTWNIAKNTEFTLAATYTPEQKINAFYNNSLYYSSDINNQGLYLDTIVQITDEKGNIVLPSTWSVGGTYRYRPVVNKDYNRNKIYEILLTGEYSQTEWTKYSANFTSSTEVLNYSNTSSYKFGIQFTPHYEYLDKSLDKKYFSKIRYRAGVSYGKLPVVAQGKQLTDFGITFGLGLPIATQRALSSVNIGFSAGNRGNGMTQSLNEKYLGINLGVTLSPGFADKWFRKYKLD